MNYRTISSFCIAFVVSTNSLFAINGSASDSLWYLLNSGLVKEDTVRYRLLYEIAKSSGDADTILKYSELAIQLAEKLNISPAKPTVLKGTGFLNSFKPASALECFIKAANLYKSEQNNIQLARTYNYMAEAYNLIGNHDNELYYLNSAISIFRNERDSNKLAFTLHNLGYAKYSMGKFDTALILYSEAGEIFQKLGKLKENIYCLGNSGLVYSKKSEFKKAEDYLLRAIKLLTEKNDNTALSQFMTEYAGILQHKGDIKKAIIYATSAFDIAHKNGIIDFERGASFRLAQLYQISGKIDSAFYYQSLYIKANDSINKSSGTKNILKMADLRTEFEVAKKQAEVDALQKKKVIQLIVIVSLTLILLLALGLIRLYYYSMKRAQKLTAALDERRILLENQSAKLKEHQEELSQQKEELQSTLENLQKTQEQLIESEKMAAIGSLVSGIAHEINTPVGIGITAISSLQDDIQRMTGLYEKDKISREDFRKFILSSQDVANLIHKNLERAAALIQSFKQVSTDQVTEHQRVFAFREYLNDILLSLRPKFAEKNITFQIECDNTLEVNSFPGVYAQIFTNLLINSLQHGFHNKDTGTIGIKADLSKDLLKIRYTDDGAGISKKDLPHIFEPFYTSDQHRGTGLGLNILYNLVKQKLHGTITCESEHGKGVLFKIEVPVNVE
ncbi:MAG: tetratricopeptide repeat-containing sensor histidine kinase [Bacteroidales bacterium]|nr:tetratricopeptide repeat-containing sensor histidine kinase [Bacteroidales bacterium]